MENLQKDSILRFDEIKQLILSLLSNLKSLDNSELTTKINHINSSLTSFYQDIKNQTSLSSNQIASLAEYVNSQFQSLSNLIESLSLGGSISSEDLLTITNIINTISNNIDALNNILTSQNTNFNTFKNSVETVLTNLTNNINTLLEKQSITPSTISSEPPYNPAPEEIFKIRDICKHYFEYSSSEANFNTSKTFFTLNDNEPAVLKVEFDLQTSDTFVDSTISLLLNGTETLFSDVVTVSNETRHFIKTCVFIPRSTHGHLVINISNPSHTVFKLKNINYEICANNINFFKVYQKKYKIQTYNDYYYVFKFENNAISYIVTPRNNKDFSQNYTQIFSLDSEAIMDVSIQTYADTELSVFTDFFVCYTDKLNGKTHSYLISAQKIKDTKFTPFTIVNCTNINYKSLTYSCGLYNGTFKRIRDISEVTYDLPFANIMNINCCNMLITSSKNLPFVGCFINFVTEEGLVYISMDTSNFTSNNKSILVGYADRVIEDLVYKLSNHQNSSYYAFRVFLHCYNYWIVKYYHCDSGYPKLDSYTILNKDYEDIVGGYGDEFFAIENGVLVRIFDPKCV